MAHRGHCYGANGGDAESHHNCGGVCRNAYVKTNPYQSDQGYGGYIYNANSVAPRAIATDDDDTDDGIVYMECCNGGANGSGGGGSGSGGGVSTATTIMATKAKAHYFNTAPLSPELLEELEDIDKELCSGSVREYVADVESQMEPEHEEDYDEDIPPIDLSKSASIESFETKVQTVKSINAEGLPVTVTTIL